MLIQIKFLGQLEFYEVLFMVSSPLKKYFFNIFEALSKQSI